MSVPLSETLNAGKSDPKVGAWAQSSHSNLSNKYGRTTVSDGEPDSSEERVAKSYKPRRFRSNQVFTSDQGTSGNLNLQHSTSRHKRKDGPSDKEGRAPKVPFTDADDEVLMEWVDEALRRGFALWSWTHWKILAEKVS
jgi:hypothetical protein